MEPTIKSGSVVLVKQWWVKPKIGEVVVFKVGQEYWVKRIKFIKGEELIVEGDNRQDSLNGVVKIKDVIGKAINLG